MCVVLEVLVPLFQSTGVLSPAGHPHTPTPALLQHPGGQSSGRDAAAMQHPLPAVNTDVHKGRLQFSAVTIETQNLMQKRKNKCFSYSIIAVLLIIKITTSEF